MSKIELYQGDCLEVMKQIPDKSIDMDIPEIIRLYTEEGYTLRRIAEKYKTNHHLIKRILERNNVMITREGRKIKPFTEEHRRRISESCKGRKCWALGKKMKKETLYKNMANHLQWNVDVPFLEQFDDIEKLKFLNKILSRERVSKHFNDEKYKKFIKKFYYDKGFIAQYERYIKSGNKYDKPSLDHIVPLSKGGSWELENLQIISWFENRAKCDMTDDEYLKMMENYFNIAKERIKKAEKAVVSRAE